MPITPIYTKDHVAWEDNKYWAMEENQMEAREVWTKIAKIESFTQLTKFIKFYHQATDYLGIDGKTKVRRLARNETLLVTYIPQAEEECNYNSHTLSFIYITHTVSYLNLCVVFLSPVFSLVKIKLSLYCLLYCMQLYFQTEHYLCKTGWY